MKVTCLKGNLFKLLKNKLLKNKLLKNKLLKNKLFIIFLSLIAVGCGGSENNTSGQSPTCANDVQVCSAPYLTALYGGGVFYFNEATEINQTVKISEGEKQTFYAIIHDSDILSGESINVTINSTTIDFADSLNGYVSPPLKMDPETDHESIPSALENYTNAEGYEIFNFTLGEDLLLDDKVVGEHNISVVSIDTKGLKGSSKIVVVIENVNDTPVISSLKHSGGVTASNQSVFEVFEEGDDGTIRIVVADEDIPHGDIVGLNITSADLPAGIISIERDKLSQSNSTNNQVEFIVHVASNLLQDTDTGEYPLDLLVYDEFGEAKDKRTITLKVKNTDDTGKINDSAISGGVSKLGSVDGSPDTFTISEGESGQIMVTIFDEDLIHTSQLEYTITGDPIREGLLDIIKVEPSSSAEEQIFLIDIGKNGSPIDDADVGIYNLNLRVADDDRAVNANYPFILKVNNVAEQQNIISVLAGTGISAAASDNSWILSEDVAGSLSIVVEDEDFGSPHNQESLRIDIRSSTLPENFIAVQQSEISRPDSSTNNRVTFRIEFTAPANQLVGEHNITFSFTDTDGNRALYEGEFRIENVNDVPVISALTHSGGVGRAAPAEENTFIVSEGGVNGTITVTVEDPDIQHGNTVSLDIINDALLGDSAFIDKYFSVEENITAPNQVEFTIHIASELMQDIDIGEHHFQLSVYDDFGGSATRDFIVIVEDTNDLTTISNFGWTGNLTSISRAPNNGGDLFTIYEGQSGQIQFTFSDEDLALTPLVVSNITGDPIDSQIINATIRTKPSPPDERILTINIGNNSSRTQKIDDIHIGTYELSLNISSSAGEVAISYPFTLQIINVNDAPEIVEITHVGDISKGRMGEFDLYQLNEGSSGFLNITIADEDLVHSHENITVRWDNPLSDELLSFDKQFFTSVDANDGTVTLILQLGQGADFDDVHIGSYVIALSIFDGNNVRINPIKSSIFLEIVNVPEPPSFPQINHHIAIFEQSGTIRMPAGTVIATVGEAYCSVADSTSNCGSPPPVLEASDPDPGDAAKLIYEIGPLGTEKFYVDGLQIKNRIPIRVGSQESFIINAIDPSGMKAVPSKEAIVTVHVKSSNNLNQDSDGDGVRDSYDGAPGNPAMQTMGSGTRANPYLIHNIYQLQAIAGVDHIGNSLQTSEFTGNSYLYGDGDGVNELAEQLSSHYRLANDVNASVTSAWNGRAGFTPIGVGACGGSPQQCDDSTAARRVSGSPTRFSGTFDGANFKISGLTINRQSSYLGLFGAAGGGSIISNLRLTSANIINPATRSHPSHALRFSHGGVLVGQMLGGTIDNVHVTGTLKGVGYRYGGVVGTLSESESGRIPGIITNSMADVDITANGVGFGGLVGSIGSNSFIHASNAKGNVSSALDNIDQLLAQDVGGLVGISHGDIFASYALGDVRGSEYVGGLVGKVLKGTTTANFAAGDVRGNRYVGGLFGAALGGMHRYSYYSGSLVGSGRIMGGIVGELGNAAAIYSVINMRSPHPSSRRSDGGLIFGLIDLTLVQNSPSIHNAYSIDVADDSLGYIRHGSYLGGWGGPLSLLGDNSGSIRKISASHLKYCSSNGGGSFGDPRFLGDPRFFIDCTDLFDDYYWGKALISSLDSGYNIDWNLIAGSYPALKVQRVTGVGDNTFIFPSHEEQRCYIEPEYTHPTHCPTTNR